MINNDNAAVSVGNMSSEAASAATVDVSTAGCEHHDVSAAFQEALCVLSSINSKDGSSLPLKQETIKEPHRHVHHRGM